MRSIIGAKWGRGGQERLGAGCGWGGVWSESRELGVDGVGYGVKLGSRCGWGGLSIGALVGIRLGAGCEWVGRWSEARLGARFGRGGGGG